MTALLALAGALIVGASDFGGGVAARRASALRITAWIQAASLTLLIAAFSLVEVERVTTTDVAAGAVAGLSGSFSFVALYAAFARGPISILAPVTAVVAAIVPTVVGMGRGDSLTQSQVLGIVVALVAIVLVTQQDTERSDGDTSRLALGLAVTAGLGFSIFFLALTETSGDAGLWPLLVARLCSLPIVAAVAIRFSGGLAVTSDVRLIIIAAGLAEGLANVFTLWAFQRGPLAVAAVLSAFYPVSTVLLARLVLSERLRLVQGLGVTLAIAAVPLVALPAA